jgi:hypothetical protein
MDRLRRNLERDLCELPGPPSRPSGPVDAPVRQLVGS